MTRVEIVVDEVRWRRVRGLSRRLERAARVALLRGGHRARKSALTILLTDNARLRALNAKFRRKHKATNVLSFAAADRSEGYLGDLALAFGVTEREARREGKSLADHATHLVVHGVLHLLGYDHATVRQARVMEPLETSILADLGIADPYAVGAKAA